MAAPTKKAAAPRKRAAPKATKTEDATTSEYAEAVVEEEPVGSSAINTHEFVGVVATSSQRFIEVNGTRLSLVQGRRYQVRSDVADTLVASNMARRS